MNIEEIRSKTNPELDYDLEQSKRELFDLRLRATTDSVPNPSRIRELRRVIARINTIMHERETGVRGQEPR